MNLSVILKADNCFDTQGLSKESGLFIGTTQSRWKEQVGASVVVGGVGGCLRSLFSARREGCWKKGGLSVFGLCQEVAVTLLAGTVLIARKMLKLHSHLHILKS